MSPQGKDFYQRAGTQYTDCLIILLLEPTTTSVSTAERTRHGQGTRRTKCPNPLHFNFPWFPFVDKKTRKKSNCLWPPWGHSESGVHITSYHPIPRKWRLHVILSISPLNSLPSQASQHLGVMSTLKSSLEGRMRTENSKYQFTMTMIEARRGCYGLMAYGQDVCWKLTTANFSHDEACCDFPVLDEDGMTTRRNGGRREIMIVSKEQ